MSKIITVGKLLIQHQLPPALKSLAETSVLDSKGINDLFDRLAKEHPDLYKDIVSNLTRLGFEVSTRLGSSVALKELLPPVWKEQKFQELEHKIKALKEKEKNPKKLEEAMAKLIQDFTMEIEKLLVDDGIKENRTLAQIIRAGARGKPMQYRQTVFSPIVAPDVKGRPMTEFIIRNSYADGLTLPEYLLSTFGARQGEVAKKLAVSDSGYFCFVGDTEVRMGDLSVKKIKDIQTGDVVLGADTAGHTFPCKVTNKFDNGIRLTFFYWFVSPTGPEIDIQSTQHHEVLLNTGDKKKLCYLAKSEAVRAISNLYYLNNVTAATETHVFDIEVDNPDHLYVLANGLIVSNSKQLSRAGMVIKVEEHDCGTDHGVPVSTEDKDSVGCFLAHPVSHFKKNNEVTAVMLNELKSKGIKSLIVRSPITCESPAKHHGGAVCQLCAGRREHRGLPPVGDYVGITAASAAGESSSQGQLSLKHSSSSAGGPNIASGLKLVTNLANIPEQFPNEAVVAEKDGEIINIRVAAQGGHYIDQTGKEYYIPAGYELLHKKGDYVEAGDALSEGIVNPAKIVRLKGIGEGRRYFAESMKSAFDQGGMGGINRRNFEMIARSIIDHVKITNNDGINDHLPGEIVHYQTLVRNYTPRAGSKKVRVDQAYDKYLEQPVLHYTIGDRVTHRRIAKLKDHGVEHVMVNDRKPDFEPEMQRLLDVPIHEHDWMHQLYSTNLERRLVHAVNTGAISDLRGPSPVPGLAYSVGFGTKTTPKVAEEEPEDEPFSFEG